MTELDRVIAGLSCREVLARLSAYLDGELEGAELATLEQHARSCDQCGRFGGRFGAVITALRQVGIATTDERERAARLRQRLTSELER